MTYFKIIPLGFDNEHIPITGDELEKALYAHKVGKVTATFENGSITGSGILMVVPDFHRAMGWNSGHKLNAEDYADLRKSGIDREYDGLIGEAKDSVQMLIEMKRVDLIGKPGTVDERLNLLIN